MSTITLTYTLTNVQANVPVIFLGINSTDYAGSFVNGNGPSTKIDFANITVTTTVTSGVAYGPVATFTIDPTSAPVGAAVAFEVELVAPTTALPSTILGPVGPTGTFTTIAGAPSKLLVDTAFDALFVNPTTKTVAGQTDYLEGAPC